MFNSEISETMRNEQEPSIDEVLKNIRSAILEKERKKYFQQFWPKTVSEKEEVFELSSSMLVKREDIPYELGLWTFDDVSKKMMKKYRVFFEQHLNETKNFNDESVRVSAKEDEQTA